MPILKHHLLFIYIIVFSWLKRSHYLRFFIRIIQVKYRLIFTFYICFQWFSLAPIDNSRFGEVEFTIPTTGTMHGFAGFFEAKLYKDIAISKSIEKLNGTIIFDVFLGIEPSTHSKNMISWFPMFFPIRVRMNKE